MKIKKVGKRGTLFTFEEGDSLMEGETSIYLIRGKNRVYLCDTHLGPKSMEYVKRELGKELNEKELIIFNSHSDFDHVWGNCAFEGATIIAHELCKERVEGKGNYDLERLKKYHNGEVKLILPNKTFNDKLSFEDDNIEFIYTPGHTICSAICYDKKDDVVFLGDLVEEPIPMLNHHNWKGYLKTLEYIKDLSEKTLISAHSGIISRELIDENIEYIKKLLDDPESFDDENLLAEYDYFRKMAILYKYEEILSEALGIKFDFKSYRFNLWNSLDVGIDNLDKEHTYIETYIDDIEFNYLENALKRYFEAI